MTAILTDTLPPVDCTPWCQAGDGHTSTTHQNDQWCFSEARRIDLGAMPLNTFNGEPEGRQTIDAYLAREHNARTATIEVCHNESTAIIYTPAEALEHARHLTELAMVALATEV